MVSHIPPECKLAGLSGMGNFPGPYYKNRLRGGELNLNSGKMDFSILFPVNQKKNLEILGYGNMLISFP